MVRSHRIIPAALYIANVLSGPDLGVPYVYALAAPTGAFVRVQLFTASVGVACSR